MHHLSALASSSTGVRQKQSGKTEQFAGFLTVKYIVQKKSG